MEFEERNGTELAYPERYASESGSRVLRHRSPLSLREQYYYRLLCVADYVSPRAIYVTRGLRGVIENRD